MNISNLDIEMSKTLAATWQNKVEKSRQSEEKRFHTMMTKMLEDPMNKIFLIELLDQSFRASDTDRAADQLEYIFTHHDNAAFFSQFEQILIWIFRHLGIYISSVSVPLFIDYLRNDISAIVIKGEDSPLSRHIQKRKIEGTRVNINIIGEIVLGEEEARSRVEKYIKLLQNPDIDYISIKISTIFSQITPLAYAWTIEKIAAPLERIYQAALSNTFINSEGVETPKFVNLDMEEYKDLRLTVEAFTRTLEKEAFKGLYAGIVIQAYLPDALEYLKKLVRWSKERVDKGGAPIKIRLVKGANQEMELTESSLRRWPCATYLNKAQTDANYKILMDYLLDKEISPYVHVGIASHNLFDHALAYLTAKKRGLLDSYTAEMLEGMSEAAYHVLKDEDINVILYAPTATRETFTNAIAYLVRRFDENTAEQNFLRHSFGLRVDSPAWEKLLKSYDDALDALPRTPLVPYRTQNRREAVPDTQIDPQSYHFKNASDTDFVLGPNQLWAEEIRDKWQHISAKGGFHAYPVVASKVLKNGDAIEVMDKSQYHEKVIIGSYTQASHEDIAKAIDTAQRDPDGWGALDAHARQKILMKAAHEFENARGDLIGVAAAEVGKVFSETDVEVSEAIDFLNFYPYSLNKLAALEGITLQPKGVGLVVSPWNFPIAIPVGGIAAALASGNRVILKPALDSVLCGYRLCQCFWEAGVSQNTLQFLPIDGKTTGMQLIPSKAIDFCIFTGGEETAYRIIKARPDIHLSAETGGKDATIVTAMADKDQAIKNVIASAFNNSGQKCSATSLLVLEREVYEDENFKKTLIDAARSLQVGSVWDFKNRIGTLSNLPSNKLKKALDQLNRGESWALEPSYADENPYILRPSIRWGTKNGDYTHINELFGPVLSVMCADDLEHAIELVNATGYGLTSGLESLDQREQEIWKEKLLAGNLYINRMTTGAIVMRQPFGGMRKSAIGSGKKAGGFNYISQFMHIAQEDSSLSESLQTPYLNHIHEESLKDGKFSHEIDKALQTASGFAFWIENEFSKEQDFAHIRGESNIIRYIGVKSVLLCLEDSDSLYEILSTVLAIKMIGSTLHISIPLTSQNKAFAWLEEEGRYFLDASDRISREDEEERIKSMYTVERIRYLQPHNVDFFVYQRLASQPLYIASEPFVGHGRVELMHYFIEQSISDSFHRYGNLGLRGLKEV